MAAGKDMKRNYVTITLCILLVAEHHRICRSTASRSPVLTRAGICVPPTVTYLPLVGRIVENHTFDDTSTKIGTMTP